MSDAAGPAPKEAVRFFEDKKLKIGFNYQDVWKEEHATNFTVAKVTELDVLGDIKASLSNAKKRGETFDTWRKNLRPDLEKRGWWGSRQVVDEKTGEIGHVNLSSPRKLRTVYEMNMRTAYNAGQWERAQRTKHLLPYFIRELGPSVHHRPEHVSWAGIMLPVDDPWFLTHPCPGGFGCKCRNRQIGRVEYDRLVKTGVQSQGDQEINPKTGLPTGRRVTKRIPVQTVAPPDQFVPWKNTSTGQTELIPKGISPGFNTNPGARYRLVSQARLLADRLGTADEATASAIVQSWVQGPALKLWLQKPFEAVPIAVVKDAQAEAIGSKSRVVMLSADTMEKQVIRHPEISPDDYAAAARVVAEGRSFQDSPNSFVFALEDKPGYVGIVQSTQTGKALFLTSYRRLSSSQAKRDRTLRALFTPK